MARYILFRLIQVTVVTACRGRARPPLRPHAIEDTCETVAEHFRVAIRQIHRGMYPVDRFAFGLVTPAPRQGAQLLAYMHHGRVNAYVAYVLLTLIVFLVAAQFG